MSHPQECPDPRPAQSEADRAQAAAVNYFANAVGEAFALVDREGRVLKANLAYRRLTGPAGGAHDASILSYLEGERREEARSALAALTEASRTRRLPLRLGIGGSFRVVDAEFTLLSPNYVAFIARDLTREAMLERERLETATARDAVEQIGTIGHWRVGRDHKVAFSAGASRILGLDPTAPPLTLPDLLQLVIESDRERVRTSVREAHARRRPLSLGLSVRRPDGELRVLQAAGAPSIDAGGQIEAVHGVVVDRTESHVALSSAMAADGFGQRFIESTPIAAALFDRDLRVLIASPRFCEDCGLPQAQVLGRAFHELFPTAPESWRAMHRKALRGEAARGESELVIGDDGRRRWLRWSCAPWREASGEVGGLVSLHEDVTVEVSARQVEDASRQRMSSGLALAAMLVWEIDLERGQFNIEGDWRDFFPSRPAFGSFAAGVGDWMRTEDREMMRAKWQAHILSGAPCTGEYRVTLADGREVWQCAHVRAIRNEHNVVRRIVAAVQDISSRKALEIKALEAEQRALAAAVAKTDFLSNISHEVRTPLNGVLAVADVLARTRLDERQAEMVNLIGTSGRTLLRVMDDLVEFSLLESDQLSFDIRPFDLEETIRAACESARCRAEAKGLRFQSFVSAGVDGVYRGDPVRISQVLGNLLNNAVKFTETGEVAITATVEESPDGLALLTLTVSDTGIGFAPELAERIFAGFEQADASTSRPYGGLGLGLSISRRLVELMKGELTAKSSPGEGSTFEVVLPLSRDRIAALGQLAPVEIEDFVAETRLGTMRLLVAEDNPMNRRVVELLLAGADVEITFAENGREAVETFRRASFDLILMDLQMPIMGGLAAMRAIREIEAKSQRPRTPIIAVSANATREHVHEAREAGADDHVAKPIVRETLFETIARYEHARAAVEFGDDAIDLDDYELAV